MKLHIAVLFMLILCAGGCGTPGRPEHVLEAKTVEVRIPVLQGGCAKGVPRGRKDEEYADHNLPVGHHAGPERYRLIAKANEQRRERLAVAEPAIEACR